MGVRQLLPVAGETSSARAWKQAFVDLEARLADIAMFPSDDVPSRFHRWTVFEEDFVVAVRRGHRFVEEPSLTAYCEMEHLVVSATGDPFGFVDGVLAARGLSRRMSLTVPDFMFALAVLAETNLLCALPRRFLQLHGPRFGVLGLEPPLPLPPLRLNGVVLKSAMADLGLSWLTEQIQVTDASHGP